MVSISSICEDAWATDFATLSSPFYQFSNFHFSFHNCHFDIPSPSHFNLGLLKTSCFDQEEFQKFVTIFKKVSNARHGFYFYLKSITYSCFHSYSHLKSRGKSLTRKEWKATKSQEEEVAILSHSSADTTICYMVVSKPKRRKVNQSSQTQTFGSWSLHQVSKHSFLAPNGHWSRIHLIFHHFSFFSFFKFEIKIPFWRLWFEIHFLNFLKMVKTQFFLKTFSYICIFSRRGNMVKGNC